MTHPDLIVGVATADDAGVYRLSDDMALVQTVDYFAPIVDDPYDWGRIAAANALSDIYAMGGHPLTALQLVGWPRADLPLDLLSQAMAGGASVMAEAGATIVGGHSIDNSAPLYGFAVTGTINPTRVVTNGGARPGDILVLTKPLGTGVVAMALKTGRATERIRREAVESMTALNGPAARVAVDQGVVCATDVSGYGLLGHLREVVNNSGVSARIDLGTVPALPGVLDLISAAVFPGGSARNLESVTPILRTGRHDDDLKVLADAQTSGGLLMAVSPHQVDEVLVALRKVAPKAAAIGEFLQPDEDHSIIEVT